MKIDIDKLHHEYVAEICNWLKDMYPDCKMSIECAMIESILVHILASLRIIENCIINNMEVNNGN